MIIDTSTLHCMKYVFSANAMPKRRIVKLDLDFHISIYNIEMENYQQGIPPLVPLISTGTEGRKMNS